MPLTIAVVYDVPWLVQLLFQLGADPNHTSSTGIVSLMRSPSVEIADYLLEKSASILPRPDHLRFPTVLHGLLHLALRQTTVADDLAEVVSLPGARLVELAPGTVNMRSRQGLTPLHIALCLPCEARSKALNILLPTCWC